MSYDCQYPGIDASDDKKKEFVKLQINPLNRFRISHQYRMAENLWFYRGVQWIRQPRQLVANGQGGYRFELESRDGFKFNLPVDNYIATNVDNAVSRFLRKQYKPDVQAEKNVPELLAAARLNRDILTHDHRQKNWRDVEHEMAFDFEVAGTAIGKTWFDETQMDLTLIASTSAMSCPGCEQKYANPRVPADLHKAQILPGTPESGPIPFLSPETAEVDGDEATLKHCPMCGQAELEPYQPSMEEAAGATDFLGRPLGEWVPKGEPVLEAVPWSQYYPENSGISEPHSVKCHGQLTPRSVDWIRARFPEFKNVKAEDRAEMMKHHPTLGMQLVFGGGVASRYDEGVYDNHALVREVHIDAMPYPGLEYGHSIYQVGEEICSRPLCVEVPPPLIDGQPIEGLPQEPKKIKRVEYRIARRKRVPGEFWGRTPVDDQKPLQRRLNRLDAQVEDIRERGIPWVAVPTDVEFHDREDVDGVLRVVEYESQNPNWDPQQAIVNRQPMTGSAYHDERDRVVQALQRLGAQDVELGKNPVGAKTIGQLQILAEEAQQQRGPAEEDLKRAYEQMFGHYLELRWAFQREKTTMEVEGTEQSFERKAYEGTDILGQTKVRIEARGSVDKTVIQSELAFRALEKGLYQLDTFSAKDEMLEILGAPKVDRATSNQVERANQAWFEFKATGQIPVVDEYSHNVALWYQLFTDHWTSDEALQIQREAEWDDVLRRICGWERYYLQAEQQDEAQRAIYEGQDPSQWGVIHQQGTAAVQQAQMAYQEASAVNPQAPPPAMTSFPAPPATGQFLPNSIDQKILMTLQGMLGPAFPNPQVMLLLDEQKMRKAMLRDRALRMYCVIQQCRILTERKAAAMAAMMPQPQPQGAPNAQAAA